MSTIDIEAIGERLQRDLQIEAGAADSMIDELLQRLRQQNAPPCPSE